MGNKHTFIVKSFQKRQINMWGLETLDTKLMNLNSERTAVDDPHWREKIASSANATNYMNAYRKWADFRPSKVLMGLTQEEYAANRIYDESHHPFPEDVIDNINSDALQKATNDAASGIRDKIRDEVETFQGLPLLGELAKTASMIAHPAEALAKAMNSKIKDFSKGKGSGGGKGRKSGLTKTTSDLWLENAMGWQPLWNDIQGIAEATLRRYEDLGIKRVQASGTGEWAYSSLESGGSNNYHQYYYNREVIGSVKVTFRAGVNTNIARSNNGLERIIENGAFGWRDALPAAWELLPWSFLVDYFSNIGDIVGAATQSMSNVSWVMKRVRSSQEVRCTGQPHQRVSDSVYTISVEPGYSRSVLTRVVREAAEIPIPGFRFELPGKTNQLLNIAALLGSRLRK